MRRRRRRGDSPFVYERNLFALHGIEHNAIKSAPNIGWRRNVDAFAGGHMNHFVRTIGDSFKKVNCGVDNELKLAHRRVYRINKKFRKIEP